MSLSVDSPLKGAPRVREAGEGPLAAGARRAHRRRCADDARPARRSSSSGTSASPSRWPRSSSPWSAFPARRALAPRRPLDRAGRQPGDPRRLLPRAHLAGGLGAPPAAAGRGSPSGRPTSLFSALGGALLVATAREWRLPRLHALWRALAAVGARAAAAAAATPPRGRRRGGARLDAHPRPLPAARATWSSWASGSRVAATLFVVIDLLQTLDRYLRIKPPLIYILEHFVYRAAGRPARRPARS